MNIKKPLLITMLAVFLTLSLFVFSVFAEETVYEGSDLPVSESYVLRAIGALEERVYAKIDTMIESLTQRLDAMQTKLDSVQNTPAPGETQQPDDETPQQPDSETQNTEQTQPQPTPSVDYTVVYGTKGQSVVGSCEIILRSGTAEALCPGANGISDLTAGADLPGGTAVSANHLLLVPRNDGRGITVTSADAYVMVRGTYMVTEPAGN